MGNSFIGHSVRSSADSIRVIGQRRSKKLCSTLVDFLAKGLFMESVFVYLSNLQLSGCNYFFKHTNFIDLVNVVFHFEFESWQKGVNI